MTDRTVSVALALRYAGFVAGAATVKAAVHDIGGELDTLAATSKDKFGRLTTAGLAAGGALTAVAALGIKAAMAFDKTMSEVGSVANANASQLQQLRQAAITTGKDTAASASDAAQAEAELAKAGLSTANILGGGLTGAVNLAMAGQVDLGEAAADTAKDLNIFGLAGSAASHVADVLTAAANSSATDVKGMSDAINQAGLVAKQTGLSFEDTAGVLALFAQNGLEGSDAGTSFKTMLQALNPTSQQSKTLMQQLGISFYNTQGRFIGISQVAQVLQDKLGTLTAAQRNAALAQIFGSDAVRAASVLYQQGAAGVQSWIGKVDNSGIAARTASQQMNNLSGDLEKLKGSVETLAIQSSGGATKGLRILTQGATGLVNIAVGLPAPVTTAATVISGLGGAGLLAASGFVKARSTGKELLDNLRDMGPTGVKAASGLGKIGGILGKAGAWGIGAFAAYEGVKTLLDYINSRSGPAHVNIEALTDDLQRFAETGNLSGDLAKIAGGGLDAFAAKLSGAIAKYRELQDVQANVARISAQNPALSAGEISAQYQSQVGAATHSLNTLLGNIDDIDAGLAGLVKNGDAADAYKVFNQLDQAMSAQGLSAAQISAEFPEYAKAATGAAQANSIAAKSTSLLTTAQGTLVLGMDDSITKGLQLKDVINSLSGANEDAEKSTLVAKQALADFTGQLKKNDDQHVKNRKSLSDSTQAGRDNLNSIINIIDADKDQFQSTYNKKVQTEDQTSALKDATSQYDDYIVRLRKTLTAEGFNAKQVDALLKLYAQIPPVETTNVKTPGLAPAVDNASALNTYLSKIDGKYVTVHVNTRYSTTGARPDIASANRWGGVYTHAADGLLTQAAYYPAASPGRYMIAEPSTMGEGFVPRKGDYARSMGIIATEASWYGATLLPGNRGGASVGQQLGNSYHSVTNIYPLKADFTERDLVQAQQVQDMRQRIGRPG